jgi:L-cysteine:1D-myo-inositol 2-amino-2-deoxy-alpha-D-glucopyranoside ligase
MAHRGFGIRSASESHVITLSDTLSGERQPLPDGPVRVYVCGITPYDTTHLGHAFTFLQFDTLVRALRWMGREVTYVQNITDIDDSILKRARELGTDWQTLGTEYTGRYVRDLATLNVAPPDHLVPATSVMPTIHALIARSLEQGSAYRVEGGDVFFHVFANPHYGELSRLDPAAMLGIAAQQDDADLDDPRKRDPLDVVLWRRWSGATDEPKWDSPWGPGRPGWHVECVAINHAYHGPRITIHGGGHDLVYPHHETEIAISECASGERPFSRLWMHTAMASLGGQKMSKSLGNLVFVDQLVPRYPPDAIRLYLLQHHYREAFEWSEDDLAAAAEWYADLLAEAREPDCDRGARDAFRFALEDDIDTKAALEAFVGARGETLRELAGVLGLRL